MEDWDRELEEYKQRRRERIEKKKDINWEKELDEYKQRRRERIEKKTPSKQMNYEKIPYRVRKHIYSFIDDDCKFITDKGRRCSRAFTYVNDKGISKDCSQFCTSKCNKWVDDVLDDLPRTMVINDTEFKIKSIEFIANRHINAINLEDNIWSTDKIRIKPKEFRHSLCGLLNMRKNLV